MKLSLGICCMDRAHHLKVTLPIYLEACNKALKENKCELIVIDYNSKDDLGQWILEMFSDEIAKGHIVYFRTTEPQSWNAAHAHNIAIRLSKGEFFCNVDVDNYFDESFIDLLLSSEDRHCMYADDLPKKRGIAGRICVPRSLLEKYRGYNEEIILIEDLELKQLLRRLERLGEIQISNITQSSHLQVLKHRDEERIQNVNSQHGTTLDEIRRNAKQKVKPAVHNPETRNSNGWGQADGVLNFLFPYTTGK